MQSYKLHVVSEHLKDRHPYLEPPFKARYDQTQVHYAVFDRSIPKLVEILLMEGIEKEKYRDALITLNELVSNENDKDSMISQGLIGIASAYIHCKVVDIRREAVLLLGSLVSTPRGLTFFDQQAFKGLEKLLFDEEIEVRNSVAWCICRIVLSRTGVEILCNNNIVSLIIQSFLKYSEEQKASQEHYIIYLLEAFTHILSYDNGISFALGTGLTSRLNRLCKDQSYSKQAIALIHYLSLDNLSKISSNPKGKEEGIQQNIIKTASTFLFSEVPQQVQNAVAVIMLTSIHLNGKKQCIYDSKGVVTTDILVKLINLLPNKDQHLKKDVIECLRIISQLKDGFLAITEYMAREGHLQYIDEIFGSQVVVSLADLLPTTQALQQPPILPSIRVQQYKAYAKALNHFLIKYDEALDIALQETVDIALKLLPFMCYRGDREIQEGTCESLIKLIGKDKYTKAKIKEYIAQYGSVMHRTSQTTLSNQINNNKRLLAAIQA